MALVFQYLSNTNTERLNAAERLNGRAGDLGAAQTVEGYRLVFDVWSAGNKCAAADLVPQGNRPAWGVLFEIPDELLSRATSGAARSFDQIEGEGTNYRRYWLPVHDRAGRLVIALTYVVIRPQRDLRTSEAYVRHILKGLRDHEVPQNYIDDVRAIAIANIGGVIRELRIRQGLSQERLAQKARLSRIYIAKLEAGERGSPSIPALQRIARALGAKLKIDLVQ